jgi:hypothetical protein
MANTGLLAASCRKNEVSRGIITSCLNVATYN